MSATLDKVMAVLAELVAREQHITELESTIRLLREILYEIHSSGVEFDDPRIGYVTVQINRVLWNTLKEQAWVTC